MNTFDTAILETLNQFAQVSLVADSTVVFIADSHLVKGAVLLLIFWWGWFRVSANRAMVRLHLISTLIGCFVAMVAARILAKSLPFRLRPMHDDGLDFTLPLTMEPTLLESWSAFPSDHAVLFYALSTGLFFISRYVGAFALLFTTVFIALPRIYLGLHYPTDIVAGASIGIVIALLFQKERMLDKLSRPVVDFSERRPEFFYPALWLVTYQVADMFNSSRDLLAFLKTAFKNLLV